VSLRLLYLIVNQLLSWLTLLGQAEGLVPLPRIL
jgi:hypothetical protein